MRQPFGFPVQACGFGLVRIVDPGGLNEKLFPQGAQNDRGGQQQLVPCEDMDAGGGPQASPQQCKQGQRAGIPDARLFQQAFRPQHVPGFPARFSG